MVLKFFLFWPVVVVVAIQNFKCLSHRDRVAAMLGSVGLLRSLHFHT
jgi:hypothetical protein